MRLLVAITILLVTSPAFSQERLTYREVDSLTYSLYEQGAWRELEKESKRAISQGYDYYYMRMRAGISSYMRKNYFKAIDHFQEALQFSEGDGNASSYLFWSYYLNGRYDQAGGILDQLPSELSEKLVRESSFKKRSLSAGVLFQNYGTAEQIAEFTGLFTFLPEGSQVIPISLNGAWASGATIQEGGNVLLYGYSFLNRTNYFYYNYQSVEASLSSQKVYQNEGYIAYNLNINRKLALTPVVHLLRTDYDYILTSNWGPSQAYVDRLTDNSLLAGMSAYYSPGIVALGVEAYSTWQNGSTILQGTGTLTLFPFGNSNYYLTSSFSVLQDGNQVEGESQFVTGLEAGFTIGEKVWINGSYLKGNLKGFASENGIVVFNGTEDLQVRTGFTIALPLGRSGFTLFGGGWFHEAGSSLDTGYNSGSGINRLKFNSKSITGGLKWNF